MDASKPIAWSYTRHSTKEQAKGDSATRQRTKAAAWANRHGFELKSIYDNGLSAFSGANKLTGQLGDFLEQLRGGRIQKGAYFLIEAFDRLSREQFTEAQRLFQEILSYGVNVVTLNNEKVYTQDIKLHDTILALVEMDAAHQYSLRLSDRVKNAILRRKENGKITHNRRNAPPWLSFIDEKRDGWQVNDDHATVVRRIFADAAGGKGAAAIARSLRSEGVTPFPAKKGWSSQNIQDLTRDRRVLGEFQREGETVVMETYFPAIIEKDLFARVNSKPAEAARGRGNGKITEANLLRGIAVDVSGNPLIHRTSGVRNRKTKEYKYYSFLQGRGDKPLRVRYDVVEERIIWLLKQMGESLFDEVRKGKKCEIDEKLESLRLDLERCEKKIKRLVTAITGDGDEDDHSDSLTELKNALKKQKEEQGRIKRSLEDLGIARNKRIETAIIPEDLSKPEVRRAVRAKIAHFFDRIVVEKESIGVEIYMGFGVKMSLLPPFEVTGFGDEKLGLIFENFENEEHRARVAGRSQEEMLAEQEAAVADLDISDNERSDLDNQMPEA